MKLSVIIPVYNVEKYLEKCLDSVIVPGLEDYEIICVNDGSTDGSPAILRRYAESYPELIKVINQENKGPSEARNAAIRAAEGDYLFLLDSDDWLEIGAIERIMQMTETGCDMLTIEFMNITDYGKVLSVSQSFGQKGVIDFRDHPEIMFTMPTGAFKTTLFTDNNILYPPGKLYEDLATIPKLFLHTDSIFISGEPLYNYLQRPGSIMNSRRAARNVEIIEALDGVFTYYRSQGAFEKYKNELEYIAYYNEYITSVVRLCGISGGRNIADKLRSDFLEKFPDYKANHYVQDVPSKIKLLDALISRRMYSAVAFIMWLNDRLKGKNT